MQIKTDLAQRYLKQLSLMETKNVLNDVVVDNAYDAEGIVIRAFQLFRNYVSEHDCSAGITMYILNRSLSGVLIHHADNKTRIRFKSSRWYIKRFAKNHQTELFMLAVQMESGKYQFVTNH